MNRRPENRKTSSESQPSLGSRGSSPFVGRDEELRRLTAALALAAEGQGNTIFIPGRPEIGKTRLAWEAVDLARDPGFIVRRRVNGGSGPSGSWG